MVLVAVAGGATGIGRTIVEEILAVKKHKVFVLSRKGSGVIAAEKDVTVLLVDYGSPEDMAKILERNQIDTVISCLPSSEEASRAQLNLIAGAEAASTVRRFAPSEFGIDYLEASRRKLPFLYTELKVAAIERLRTTALEYTRFVNGNFMDYLDPTQASHLKLISLILDFETCTAAVPGDGNMPAVMTRSRDVAKFVAAALDLDAWDEMSLIVGDRISLNDVVAKAEAAKGRKFNVVYDTIDNLKAGKSTELPSNVPRYAFVPRERIDFISQNVGIALASGWMNIPGKRLNDRLPEVQYDSVGSFFAKHGASE